MNSVNIGRWVALVILLSLPFSTFGQAGQTDKDELAASEPQATYTAKGVAGCLECHGGVRMKLVADTAHGDEENPHTPYANNGCESCHGPGSFHSSRAHGRGGFPALLSFRQWESTDLHNEACLNCHGQAMGENEGMKWNGSLHQARGMTCVYCHQTHVTTDKMQDQQSQRERCAKCHSSKIATHTGGEALLALQPCAACHKVHELARD